MMKKQILSRTAAVLLAVIMLSAQSLPIFAQPNPPFAYNIYSNPVINVKEEKFDIFTIDFMSTQTPYHTYWALANFEMFLSTETRKAYRGISGGGCYAGLQDRGSGTGRGHSAILSFWEWSYRGAILRAERLYPRGAQSEFGGEGEGTNWITPYAWQDNQWYRMVLRSWTDIETGTTFCGQWFQDQKTGRWTCIAYFDTKLINSCMEGNMDFFMENYNGLTRYEERDAYLKNIYVRTYGEEKWVSVNKSVLSHCNNWAKNKTGAHSFGATDDYFWGVAGGKVENQTQYEKDNPVKGTFTIKQPATPTFGTPAISSVTLKEGSDVWTVKWSLNKKGTPQLSYAIEVTDVDGNVLLTKAGTRPEVVNTELEGLEADAFLCKLTVTDLFGETATAYAASESYTGVVPADENKPAPETPETELATSPAEETDAPKTEAKTETEPVTEAAAETDPRTETEPQTEPETEVSAAESEPAEEIQPDPGEGKEKSGAPTAVIVGIAAAVIVVGAGAVVLAKRKKK